MPTVNILETVKETVPPVSVREVKTVTPEEIIITTKEYLATQPDVAVAYVFGSVARGRMWAQSDVDVAVIFAPEAGDKPARFDRRLELEMALGDLVHKNVQVVDFETAPVLLRYQIRKHGRVVVDKDPLRRVKLEAAAIGEYLDFQPVRQFCTAAKLGRL
ncbi:MAG: nucleotidyltransferase domain-containing protein [Bacillota bacterium]